MSRTFKRNRFHGLVALLAAGLACFLMVPAASASIDCTYVAAGPDGPEGNRLEITAKKFEEAVALLPGTGANIRVMDDQRMKPLRCAGGKPTKVNLDRVDFTADRGATGSAFYIVEAPEFGPGATPAAAGGKGITVIAKGPAISFGIGGTDGSDLIDMGMAGKAAALDFSPDLYPDNEAGDNIDAKIFAGFTNILVRGGNGDDVVSGSRIAYENTWIAYENTWFDGPLKVPTSVYGEGGADELLGGWNMDYLDGGLGNDYLSGGAGADQLYGGPGLDGFVGGAGRDEIDSTDGKPRESVKCGKGRDLARMDLKDEDRDCESFLFP